MQFTISLLPATLSLVHIPRSRISQLFHPILKQILQPNPIFSNITCNDLELSIFADESVLDDFQPISRNDRRMQRSRSNPGSSKKIHDIHPVEISYEKWSVLQVDSHSDQLGVYRISYPVISNPPGAQLRQRRRAGDRSFCAFSSSWNLHPLSVILYERFYFCKPSTASIVLLLLMGHSCRSKNPD